MREVAWQEVNSRDQIVTKRKAFDTEEKMEKFIEKLDSKDNFICILAIA